MAIAGRINRHWWDGATCNGTHEDIEDWFQSVVNQPVEIDEQRCVWLTESEQWMDQQSIRDALKRINAGV